MKKRRADSQIPAIEREPLFNCLDLAQCHPLVASTGRYLERVATELALRERDQLRGESWPYRRGSFYVDMQLHGRIDTHGDDRLRIVATLRNAEWILCFHDKLLAALERLGCKVEIRKYKKKHAAFILAHDAVVPLWFSEDFSKREDDGRRGYPTYVAKDSYQVRAEPLSIHPPKEWRGNQQRLDGHVDEIANDLEALLRQEARFNEEREQDRMRREQRAAEMKVWFAEQDLKRQRKEERRAQVGRLLQAASGHDEYLWATNRLAEIEAAAPHDEAIRVWVAVVRESLTDPHAALIESIRSEAAKEQKPLWWPEHAQPT